MKKNTLEAFKKAIQEKYEVEKWLENSHFLLQPSRAKLRDLCFELYKENDDAADLMCFKAFLGFEFSPVNGNKLKTQTDKFRPIETFLKGETDLNDLAGVNMAAVLVHFKPRPFLKFSRLEVQLAQSPLENNPVPPTFISNEIAKDTAPGVTFSKQIQPQKSFLFRKSYVLLLPLLLCITGFYGYKMYNQKECMQWTGDHYERVSCRSEHLGLLQSSEKMALDEAVIGLRKLKVSDTTVFFKNDKPQIWYSKRNKKVDFFNGPGFHPESGKPLKPITKYMIEKYVLAK